MLKANAPDLLRKIIMASTSSISSYPAGVHPGDSNSGSSSRLFRPFFAASYGCLRRGRISIKQMRQLPCQHLTSRHVYAVNHLFLKHMNYLRLKRVLHSGTTSMDCSHAFWPGYSHVVQA